MADELTLAELAEIEALEIGTEEFVAAARTDVPRLCAVLRQVMAERDEGLDALRALYDAQNGPPLLREKDKQAWEAADNAARELLKKHGK